MRRERKQAQYSSISIISYDDLNQSRMTKTSAAHQFPRCMSHAVQYSMRRTSASTLCHVISGQGQAGRRDLRTLAPEGSFGAANARA